MVTTIYRCLISNYNKYIHLFSYIVECRYLYINSTESKRKAFKRGRKRDSELSHFIYEPIVLISYCVWSLHGINVSFWQNGYRDCLRTQSFGLWSLSIQCHDKRHSNYFANYLPYIFFSSSLHIRVRVFVGYGSA